jgi:hypothetical protein
LCIAAANGNRKQVLYFIESGASVSYISTIPLMSGLCLTAMGYAILRRDLEIAALLKEKEANIDEVGLPSYVSIDLFFIDRAYKEDGIEFLRWLISSGANLHSLQDKTLTQIALYANYQECNLLMRNSPHIPLSSFLNIVLVQLEMAPSSFKNDFKLKMNALFLKGAAADSRHYFHFISDGEILEKLGHEISFDPTAKEDISGELFDAIELAHTPKAIDALSILGADRALSPFLKETHSHKKALERVGFAHSLPEVEQYRAFIKAIITLDIRAVIALIGAGIDPCWQEKESGWTLLHFLFSMNMPLMSSKYEEIAMSDRITRIIHILMTHGARPLLDSMLRTPLMCLSRKEILKIDPLVNLYIHFEATANSIPFDIYKGKLLAFLANDFPKERGSAEDLALKWCLPAFKDFWRNVHTYD